MRIYHTLTEYPHDMVELECECGRHGRLRSAKLIAEHEPDIKLPDLLREIAQCPKRGNVMMPATLGYSPLSTML